MYSLCACQVPSSTCAQKKITKKTIGIINKTLNTHLTDTGITWISRRYKFTQKTVQLNTFNIAISYCSLLVVRYCLYYVKRNKWRRKKIKHKNYVNNLEFSDNVA